MRKLITGVARTGPAVVTIPVGTTTGGDGRVGASELRRTRVGRAHVAVATLEVRPAAPVDACERANASCAAGIRGAGVEILTVVVIEAAERHLGVQAAVGRDVAHVQGAGIRIDAVLFVD